MVTNRSEHEDRLAFAARLNLALDEAGVPPKGKGRQTHAAKIFGVTQKGARKWLEAESMPETHRIPGMLRKINALKPDLPPLREEWLLFGRGPMRETPAARPANEPETALLCLFRQINAYGQAELLAYAEFLRSRYPLDVKHDLASNNIRGSHYMSPEETAAMHRALHQNAPRYNFTEGEDEPTEQARGKRRRTA